MSLPKSVHPALLRFVRAATLYARQRRGRLVVTSGYRSRATQARLYRRFLAGAQGLYNVQPPGRSQHEHGLAVDLITTPRWIMYELGELWRSAGQIWGGLEDPVHFGLR